MNAKKEQHSTDKSKVRILVVDDHAIVREGLIRLINQESNLMVCAQAENANQALDIIEKQQVDLAIVDISLEGVSGLELTERMKLRKPDLVVLILSMHDELFYAQRAIRAGAAGYVSKQEAAEKIITAICQVLRGETYVSESKIIRNMSDAASDDRFDSHNRASSDCD